jgi:hypothetical protein
MFLFHTNVDFSASLGLEVSSFNKRSSGIEVNGLAELNEILNISKSKVQEIFFNIALINTIAF